MPNNRQFSNGSRRYSRCCGVLEDWSQCDIEVMYGIACYDHAEQARWLQGPDISSSERVDHAKSRRCPGLIDKNVRLCRNRKRVAFDFCRWHEDQGPPTWALPSSLPRSKDSQHIRLRRMFLDLVFGACGRRNPFRKRARRYEDMECQCRSEARGRGQREEENRRRHDWEEYESQRRGARQLSMGVSEYN